MPQPLVFTQINLSQQVREALLYLKIKNIIIKHYKSETRVDQEQKHIGMIMLDQIIGLQICKLALEYHN